MAKILIIDDDAIVQIVLKKALQAKGYEAIVAKNGEDGIEQAYRQHPALIICDWMMPGMDGLEVCRRIKQESSLSATFFILLTSRSNVEDRVEGLDNGADDYLAKPIEFTELTARVRAGLRQYQLHQELQEQKQLLETQKQLLESELNEAAEYVRSLLPKPLSSPVKIDSIFIPSTQLGGDCFDYHWIDDNRLIIYLIDTSGHGVGAALLSISVLNLLRSQDCDRSDLCRPSTVMKKLNQAFQMNLHGDRYFSIWYGVYHKSEQRLTYASAGHPPVLSISKDSAAKVQVQKLESLSMPIGVFSNAEFVDCEYHIDRGSKLYIFSDGIYEFKLANGSPWGIDCLSDLLVQEANSNDSKNIERVMDLIRQINGSEQFDDDVSLLQVQFN